MPHRIKTQWSTKGLGIEPALQQCKKYLQNRGNRDCALKRYAEIVSRRLKGMAAAHPKASLRTYKYRACQFPYGMKLKIKITGPKVHEVGYRIFLGKLAMSLAIPGFMAFNWDEEGQQEVIAFVEGDEMRIAAFKSRAH